MNKKLTIVRLLLAVFLGPFAPLPAWAASLQFVPNWGASGVPTNLSMYIYVPDRVATNPPILVLLHYWGGGASGVFAEAQNGGIVAAADRYGFIMVVPQNPDCWDAGSLQSLTHDGGGQTQGIAQMVQYTINTYHANADRVYVTGTSCGGVMTEALLGVYPEIFKAGAAFAGTPVGGAWTPITHTAQQWGNIVRSAYPGYSGRRPRVQIWHGTSDGIINYSNQLEAIMQWTDVLGLNINPTTTATLTILNITNQWTHQTWQDAGGNTVLDAWSEIGGGHGTDANLNAQYVIPFLGLDKVGPVDPVPPCASGYSRIEAENYFSQSGGIQVENCSEGGLDITGIQNGSYVVFKNIDFGGGAASFQTRVASTNGGTIELHLDSLTGTQVGVCTVTNTGGLQTWATQSYPVGGAVGGHDLYLRFMGGSGNLFALNWLRFNAAGGVDIGGVDIGGAGPGSASSSNGVFTVLGAGTDIQGTADVFHYLYVTASGDCTIVARVSSEQNVNAWSKAGLMIRESLDPGAANALIALTPANGVTWQCRSTTNGSTTYNTTPGLTAPCWLKLARSANSFTAFRSPDGANWTQQGTATFNMAPTAYIGLAVCSHNSSTLCAATFDNITAPGWLTALTPAPSGLFAAAASSSQINLTWNAVTNAAGYTVKRSVTSGGPYTTLATGVTSNQFVDNAAPVGIGCCYVVSAIVGDTETLNSAEATPTFPELTGAILGTSGSWNNSGNTIAKLFDNDLNTFFDGPVANGCWAGLDFGAGASNVIAQIGYSPRSGFESRMVNGIFQGANRADFGDAAALGSVNANPIAGALTVLSVSNAGPFRYVRYVSPDGGYGNAAELKFYGYHFTTPPRPLLGTTISANGLVLSWPVFSAGFTVQSRTNLVLGNWVNVPLPAPQIAGTQWQVALPVSTNAGSIFYRLIK